MKIGTRIFLLYLLLFFLCFAYPFKWFADNLEIRYREGVEDPLADQANILAGLAEVEMRRHAFSKEEWRKAFEGIYRRVLDAQIYDLHKKSVDSHMYLTDEKGIVLFDSRYPENEGKDFSRWRDVALTLRGEYGARSTKIDPWKPEITVLYVSAPIYGPDGIAGVLTVGKPTTNIKYLSDQARYQTLVLGFLSLFCVSFLSFFVAIWITRPIKRLTAYARQIRDGGNPPLPKLDQSEIGEMGQAFREMQETLLGKNYVEQYIQHMTHELKSPLSVIRGVAELMTEASGSPMPEERKKRFLRDIFNQALRIQEIVDRMLELSSLENRKDLALEPVSLSALVRGVAESKENLLHAGKLRLELDMLEKGEIMGDLFLLHQALGNMVQNAIDFSPEHGTIRIKVRKGGETTLFQVSDRGPGVPNFAMGKVFDKFFSLQRPATGEKSTGLGLNFVRQVALLHRGNVAIRNLPEGGTSVMLEIPNH